VPRIAGLAGLTLGDVSTASSLAAVSSEVPVDSSCLGLGTSVGVAEGSGVPSDEGVRKPDLRYFCCILRAMPGS